MSIINDALKKTQKKLQSQQEKSGQPEPTPQTPPAAPQTPPDMASIYAKLHKPYSAAGSDGNQGASSSGRKSVSGVLLFLLFLSAAGGGGYYYWQYQQEKQKKPKADIFAPKAYRPKPVPAPNKNELVLNGTMMMDDKRVALINNEIYEVGQDVNGRRILSISLEKVEIEENGETKTLKVKNY